MKDTAPGPAPAKEKKPRRALTLEEREEKARQQAARAAQALAKVRAARKREELHVKACAGEIILALAEKDPNLLENIIKQCETEGISVSDHHKKIIASVTQRIKSKS